MQRPSPPLEPTWLPPPGAAGCLLHPYTSNPLQRGGTLIAEGVYDRETHRRYLGSSDAYRPTCCPTCGHPTLHRHDYTDRKVLGEHGPDPVVVLRFQCANEACGALWRVLPAFVARYLWYPWRTVEAVTTAAPPAPPPSPPLPSLTLPSPPSRRTVGRWRERLASSARVLVQLFAALAEPVLSAMIVALVHGIDATRGEFVAAYGDALDPPASRRLAALAGHLHRAAPGLRLM